MAVRRRAALVAAALGALVASAAPSQPTMDEICAKTACWPGGVVVVPNGGGGRSEQSFPRAPYYYDGFALLVSGQTLFLEATVRGDELVLERMPEVRDAARTLVATLEAQESGRTRLKVTNPLGRPISYGAMVHRAIEGGRLQRTTTCPVLANGGAAYEQWPYPVFRAALARFAFAAPGDTDCRLR